MVIIPLPSCSATGGRGTFAPPPPLWFSFLFVCVSLVVSSSVGHGLVPLPPLCKYLDTFLKSGKNVSEFFPPPPPTHTHTNTHTHTHPLATFYGSRSSSKTFWQFCTPPPPPKQTSWRRPLPYPIMVIIPPPPPPPPADCRFQGQRSAQRDILPGLWKCCSITSLVWYGSGVHGEVTVHVAG